MIGLMIQVIIEVRITREGHLDLLEKGMSIR